MEDSIINKVANSNLITLDLEDYYDSRPRIIFDIAEFLFENMIIKEKDFREKVKNYNWNQFLDSHVAVINTSDAIIPLWAYMVISNKLADIAPTVIIGNLDLLNIKLYVDAINNIDATIYQDSKVVIKGCGTGKVPLLAYSEIVKKLSPVVSSLMFGEPCSTVPIYKRK